MKNGTWIVLVTLVVWGHTALSQGEQHGIPSVKSRDDGTIAIVPLATPVLAGKVCRFEARTRDSVAPSRLRWDMGDGTTATGGSVAHTYQQPGVYRVVLGVGARDKFHPISSAIVRAHTPETPRLPQILLDTDARNEVDDQHYIAYGLFSNLDVLGINSIHHGGGSEQEPMNYGEILFIMNRARESGLSGHRSERLVPNVYHGAPRRLSMPESGRWTDPDRSSRKRVKRFWP